MTAELENAASPYSDGYQLNAPWPTGKLNCWALHSDRFDWQQVQDYTEYSAAAGCLVMGPQDAVSPEYVKQQLADPAALSAKGFNAVLLFGFDWMDFSDEIEALADAKLPVWVVGSGDPEQIIRELTALPTGEAWKDSVYNQ